MTARRDRQRPTDGGTELEVKIHSARTGAVRNIEDDMIDPRISGGKPNRRYSGRRGADVQPPPRLAEIVLRAGNQKIQVARESRTGRRREGDWLGRVSGAKPRAEYRDRLAGGGGVLRRHPGTVGRMPGKGEAVRAGKEAARLRVVQVIDG